jgi:hypothetical protein
MIERLFAAQDAYRGLIRDHAHDRRELKEAFRELVDSLRECLLSAAMSDGDRRCLDEFYRDAADRACHRPAYCSAGADAVLYYLASQLFLRHERERFLKIAESALAKLERTA